LHGGFERFVSGKINRDIILWFTYSHAFALFLFFYIVRLFASARNKQTKRLRFWNVLHAAAQPTAATIHGKYLLNPYCFTCPIVG